MLLFTGVVGKGETGPGLECVSKVEEMQFRVGLAAFQGAFSQVCWRQTKEKQHRNAAKDAENACSGF